MKKLLIVLFIVFLTVPAFAGNNVAGVKVDLPDLIKITDDISVGLEAGKDVLTDIGYPSKFDYVESDKGYFGYLKVTCKFSLIDFTKK